MMLVSDFIKMFEQKLYSLSTQDDQRELLRQEKVIKGTLFTIIGQNQRLSVDKAVNYQESFHVRLDQLAGDYRTWRRGGCKKYAKPKQLVSGTLAALSKKSFDFVLNYFMSQSTPTSKGSVAVDESVLTVSKEKNTNRDNSVCHVSEDMKSVNEKQNVA